MSGIRSTEMAKRLGVSDSSVRDWSTRYAGYLSPTGRGLVDGAVRTYTLEDQTVLATIAHLRAQGIPHEMIEEQLEDNMRVDPPPPLADDGEEKAEAQRERGLVPVAQLNRAIDEIQRLNARKEELESKLEEARNLREKERKENTERIIQLEREVSDAKARMDMLERMLEEEKKRKKRGLFGGGD